MDELIQKAGEFGPFQYKVITIVGLVSALSSASIYATIFIAAEPDFYCLTSASASINSTNETLKLTSSLEWQQQQYQQQRLSYEESCQLWTEDAAVNNNKSVEWCTFDRTYYGRTIITDWLLTCDEHYKASLTQTVHIFGSIFGVCSGVLGDRFGRRTSVLVFSLALTVNLLFTQLLLSIDSFGHDVKYIIFSASQFLIGFLVNCLYCTAYVLLMEFTTEHFRTKIANLNSYVYVLGELIVLVVYYCSRNWHVLNWFVGTYSLVLLVLIYFYLPESPAWYISQNKLNRALKVLKHIARTNGKRHQADEITYALIKSIKEQERSLMNETDETIDYLSIKHHHHGHHHHHHNNVQQHQQSNGVHEDGGEEKLVSSSNATTATNTNYTSVDVAETDASNMSAWTILGDLFRPRKNCMKTLLLSYIWAALMLLYYGISLGVTSLDLVDPYLMYFLSCIAELVGYFCCYVNDLLGRKKTLIGFLLTTTLIYAVIAFLTTNTEETAAGSSMFSPKVIAVMIFALIGKGAVSGAYNISYIYTAELHPTYTRNTALLFLNCFGSVSSLIAPQINMLKNFVARAAPYVVYSICALFGCLCVWVLPETKVD